MPREALDSDWETLAAPIPQDRIQWRQDGKPIPRQGRWFARFVAYIDAQFVRERLDAVFPGNWELKLSLWPERGDEDGVLEVGIKAELTVAGVPRDDVGSGTTYKNAASDAFKRAAVRFGVAAELYSYGQNWVEVESDSKYAKPVEDPALAYARRVAREAQVAPHLARLAEPTRETQTGTPLAITTTPRATLAAPRPAVEGGMAKSQSTSWAPIPCPKCGARMWDNRATRKGKQPDYKCRANPDHAVWLDDDERAQNQVAMSPVSDGRDPDDFPDELRDDPDDLPF